MLAFRSVLVRVLIIVSAAVALATAVLWLMGSPAALASGWSIQRAPELAGAIPGQLNGVSCPSPTACSAVGSYTNVPGVHMTVVERWNGKQWSIQPTPNPARATGSSLNGVSCASQTACTAVGSYTNALRHELTLVERWNGKRWSIQPTPIPPASPAAV